ncbi:MAG: holo-ACP synthase [Planctomycetota bacterium]
MNIIAHGIDIVRCERIEHMWRDHADRFLDRVYTPAEQQYCLNCKTQAVRLAGRFAVKEAVMKVLGTGWRGGIRWTDIETLPDPLGKPLLTLHGESAKLAQSLGIERILISISHTQDHAIASAIAIAKQHA